MPKLQKSSVHTPVKRARKQAARTSAQSQTKSHATKTKKQSRVKKSSKKFALRSLWLTRFEKNPIIMPSQENAWEAWQTFNPGQSF